MASSVFTNVDKYFAARDALIEYLKHKTEVADWHGVSDAANDLRVLEAEAVASGLVL